MWKKVRPKSVILQSWKNLQALETIFFRKKNLPAYLCRYDLQNCVWKFFKNKWVSIYLNFGDFKVLKNHSSQENINKTRSTKTQENSAHRFGGNYLTNRLVKFQQDRNKLWRVGALRVCTSYSFFYRKSLERAF